MSSRTATLLAVIAICGLPGATLAQSAIAADRTSDAASRPNKPLSLRLKLGTRGLDPESVRVAVERELGTGVVTTNETAAALVVEIETEQRVNVRYTRPGGEVLSRSVDLPEEPARAVEVIALLSGNLVRNEASELARALREQNAPAPPEASSDAAVAAPPPVAANAAPKPSDSAAQPARRGKKKLRKQRSSRGDVAGEDHGLLRGAPLSANLSLYHPIATFSDSERRVLNVELGLAYSRVGALAGIGWQLGVLEIDGYTRGWAGGLLYTHTRGPVRGLTSSVFLTRGFAPLEGATLSAVAALHGPVEGAELAGIVAVAEHVEGFQGGGLVSRASSLRGAQVSGAVGVVQGRSEGWVSAVGLVLAADVEGVAVAAGLNSARDIEGAAVAAGVNLVRDVDGASLGSVNIGRDVRGASIGVVNIGRRVDGFQLGVLNIASEVNGASLGVVSVAGNGRVQPMAWTSGYMPVHASVKFLVGYAYSEAGVGYDPANDHYALEAGLGGHIPVYGPLSVEPGVHYSDEQDPNNEHSDLQHDLQYRVRAAWRVGSVLEPFVGGGVRHGIAGAAANQVSPEFFAGLALF